MKLVSSGWLDTDVVFYFLPFFNYKIKNNNTVIEFGWLYWEIDIMIVRGL